jgi:hypothetical protein
MKHVKNAAVLTAALNSDKICWLLYNAQEALISGLIKTDRAARII